MAGIAEMLFERVAEEIQLWLGDKLELDCTYFHQLRQKTSFKRKGVWQQIGCADLQAAILSAMRTLGLEEKQTAMEENAVTVLIEDPGHIFLVQALVFEGYTLAVVITVARERVPEKVL